jgi:very-long-chain enoyl-CoA reductase
VGAGKDSRRLTEPEKTLVSLGVQDGDELVFKDLGPQISWTTVFLVEYLGPILIHGALFFLPVYSGSTTVKTDVQKAAFAMVVFHYVKRELETLFVHRFSNDTMPFFNIFKNSAHYWLLSGLFIAYPLYHPLYTNTMPHWVLVAAAAVFFLGELGNLWAHIKLRNLRRPGTRDRNIPRGGLFELVSCANYTYELVAWAGFCVFSQVLTAWLFWLVSFGQIAVWALKKHKRYREEFGKEYPRGRKALVPFLL